MIQRTASQSACVEAQSPELLTAVFRMLLRQPLDQKIQSPLAALRADAAAPARPLPDQPREADQPDDFLVRGVLDQAARGPILIQPSEFVAAFQDFTELGFVNIVIPEVGDARGGFHKSCYSTTRVNPAAAKCRS